MNTQLTIILENRDMKTQIATLQAEMAQPNLTNRQRAVLNLKIAEVQEARDEKIKGLLSGGSRLTVTEIAAYVSKELGQRYRAQHINDFLIAMGLQTRNGNSYIMTDIAANSELGVAYVLGQQSSVRWDESLVKLLCDYLTLPETEDESAS